MIFKSFSSTTLTWIIKAFVLMMIAFLKMSLSMSLTDNPEWGEAALRAVRRGQFKKRVTFVLPLSFARCSFPADEWLDCGRGSHRVTPGWATQEELVRIPSLLHLSPAFVALYLERFSRTAMLKDATVELYFRELSTFPLFWALTFGLTMVGRCWRQLPVVTEAFLRQPPPLPHSWGRLCWLGE